MLREDSHRAGVLQAMRWIATKLVAKANECPSTASLRNHPAASHLDHRQQFVKKQVTATWSGVPEMELSWLMDGNFLIARIYDSGETLHAKNYLFWCDTPKADSHAVAPYGLAFHEKFFPGHVSHFLGYCLTQHGRRIDLFRQFNPGKEAAVRIDIAGIAWQHRLDAVHHHVPALLMDLTDLFQVRLEKALIEEFRAKDLRDHIGMRVSSHLSVIHFPDDLSICKDISQSGARGEDLGEAVHIYSVARFVEELDRGKCFPAVAQLTVRIIL